ncbi:MAG TPA: glycosyltransferase [Steroidobacteraceae bacterium]
MKFLHVIASLNPADGGPREGICRRGIFLKERGHQVDIATLDDPAAPFLKDAPLTVYPLGPSSSGYRYSNRLVPWLKLHAREYDGVIVHGLWQFQGLGTRMALRRLGMPYYVFPHGMLDPWFKERYPLKHLKKWLYWPWGEYRVLRDAKAVLFTSEEERLLARKSFWLYRARERVVAYGTSPPPTNRIELRQKFYERYPELRDRRFLLFLSRIHEKKGCDLLIEAFAKASTKDRELHLVIAGPSEPQLMQTLQQMVNVHSLESRVTFLGMLQGELKWGAFYAAEAFVLPSHQENFGIAVAEALGCGVPVLISNKVNIWREITAAHAGFVEDDTQPGIDRLLARWIDVTAPVRTEMARNAVNLFERQFKVDAMAQSLLDVVAGVPA